MKRNFVFSSGEYYHIYSRGVEKRKIFLDKGDYDRFVKLLFIANSNNRFNFTDVFVKGSNKKFGDIDRGETLVSIGAWCIMPNHFHILLREKDLHMHILEDNPQEIRPVGVALFMKKLLTGYSMYFNTKYHRKGRLFENTFNAKHLNTDQYLKYQYTYIHLNPIGIVDSGWKEKKIKDKPSVKKFLVNYPYSSFQDYSGVKREEGLIIEPKVFPEYFATFTDFGKMIDEWVDFDTSI